MEFFEAYIPDEEEYHLWMAEKLNHLSTDISYAILKGVCDDINIWKFSKRDITKEVIEDIIAKKVQSANKDDKVEKTDRYVL